MEDFYTADNGKANIQFQIDDAGVDILTNKLDLYIPKYNIAIEIDKKEHKYKRDYDLTRQNYIENQIHCKFIRVNEGESCGSVIARITKELYKSA